MALFRDNMVTKSTVIDNKNKVCLGLLPSSDLISRRESMAY